MSEAPSELYTYLEDEGFDDMIMETLENAFGDIEGLDKCSEEDVNRIFVWEKMKDELFISEYYDPEDPDCEEEKYDKETFEIYVEMMQELLAKRLNNWLREMGVVEELVEEFLKVAKSKADFKKLKFDELKSVVENTKGLNKFKINGTLRILEGHYIQWLPPHKRKRWEAKKDLQKKIEDDENEIRRYLDNIRNKLNKGFKLTSYDTNTKNLERSMGFGLRVYNLEVPVILGDKADERVGDQNRNFEKYIEQVNQDLIDIKVDEWEDNEFFQKLKSPLLGQIYSVDWEGKTLKRESNLNDLTESLEFSSRPYDLPRRGYHLFKAMIAPTQFTFTSRAKLEEFKESVVQHGFVWDKFYENRDDGLKIEGAFDWRKEWADSDKVVRAFKKAGEGKKIEDNAKAKLDLINALVFKSYQRELFLNFEKLKLNEEAIDAFLELRSLEGGAFEKRLLEFERQNGTVFNAGNFYLGGIFMVTGSIEEEINVKYHYEMQRLILDKLKSERESEIFEANVHRIDDSDESLEESMDHYQIKYKDQQEKAVYRFWLKHYNKIKTEFHTLGRDLRSKDLKFLDFKHYRQFTNHVLGSNQFWRVMEQELQLTYLADLLTTPCSLAGFRARGLTTLDVVALKKRLWASFRERTKGKIESRAVDTLEIFDHKFTFHLKGVPESEASSEELKKAILKKLSEINYLHKYEKRFEICWGKRAIQCERVQTEEAVEAVKGNSEALVSVLEKDILVFAIFKIYKDVFEKKSKRKSSKARDSRKIRDPTTTRRSKKSPKGFWQKP